MSIHTQALQELIDAFAMLPGIGRKSATRLAFYLIRQPSETSDKLAQAITSARSRIKFCETCQNLCETSPCERCSKPVRDDHQLCVVESPQDLIAIESTHEFYGRYHVLHGAISPLDGITPNDLKIRELIARLGSGNFSEVILATNPSIEGEATAAYLKRLIEPLGIKVTRIASGLPMGAQLEYADKATLGRSLLDRREI
ncbi:MAG: recombination protein RecR [Proteobacteria bacterium]|nr:recombination protein RecR [Pseudomonadota bacterium]